MIKKILTFLLISLAVINSSVVLAASKGTGEVCEPAIDTCPTDYSCQPSQVKAGEYKCQESTIGAGGICNPSNSNIHCINGYSCQPSQAKSGEYKCQESSVNSVFGQITPPDALKGLVSKDPTGAGGVSILLSNIIQLFYSVAAVVLIFMLLWGAYDWITSEGNKEKIESARNKIINAVIGTLLFAVAFAAIKVLGQFTGFKFFVGQ